jgi:hypothetical protein
MAVYSNIHVAVGHNARVVLLADALVQQHVLAVHHIGRRAVLVVVLAAGQCWCSAGVSKTNEVSTA